MKQLLIIIAALVLVGCGGSKSFTEIIYNPWTWIGILANLGIVLPFVLVIIIVGYFLVKFFCCKNKDEKVEELKDEEINK